MHTRALASVCACTLVSMRSRNVKLSTYFPPSRRVVVFVARMCKQIVVVDFYRSRNQSFVKHLMDFIDTHRFTLLQLSPLLLFLHSLRTSSRFPSFRSWFMGFAAVNIFCHHIILVSCFLILFISSLKFFSLDCCSFYELEHLCKTLTEILSIK